jgi:hypothetical protein
MIDIFIGMSKRFVLTEDEKESIKKLYMIEQSEEKDDRKFCHGGNVKTLEDIVGSDELEDYIEGVQLRKNGVGGLTDRLELLKTLRIHPNVSDGGEHIAYNIMNQLKEFKPYNYFDETKKQCNRAMDKIIELYKENEHGEELVKDIEKVYALSNVSQRAKEFLKHGLAIILWVIKGE